MFQKPIQPKRTFRTMRSVFHQLVRELGDDAGREMFEWYCRTYGVTIADDAPATVLYEVFGVC